MTWRSQRLRFLQDLVGHPGDECVDWPFAVFPNGYGQMRYQGRSMAASRVMCLLAQGEPPEGQDQTAHSCARKLCVNPKHLRWASAQENYTAEDAALAQRLLDILREEDPEAFINIGSELTEPIAIDGHWSPLSLVKRLEAELQAMRQKSGA